MKKSKGIVSLVLIAALLGLLGFTCWQGFGSSHTGSARNINLGLDLAGGVSITYQAKDKNPSAEDMKDTIYKLQKRVEQYSTEAQVYQEGSDRITVEIPGVTDADAILNDLGKPGSLYFILPPHTTSRRMQTAIRTLPQDRMVMYLQEAWMRSRSPAVLFWKVVM